MSPKTTTFSLLAHQLLFLTGLTTLLLLVSSGGAVAASGNYTTTTECLPCLLGRFDLPPGFFPPHVKFTYEPGGCKGSDSLQIELRGRRRCPTSDLVGIRDVLLFEPKITACISQNKLFNLTGVTLSHQGQLECDDCTVTVKELKSFCFFSDIKILLFSYKTDNSTCLTTEAFPSFPRDPLQCVHVHKPHHSVDDQNSADGVVVAKEDYTQEVPKWVHKYGRLLPVVVSA